MDLPTTSIHRAESVLPEVFGIPPMEAHYVYFASLPDGSIKIGTSLHPKVRLYQLSLATSEPHEWMLAVYLCGYAHENALHERFRAWRRRPEHGREYFDPCEPLLELIRQLSAHAVPYSLFRDRPGANVDPDEVDAQETLAYRMYARRTYLNLTMGELAREARVSKPYVSRLERGHVHRLSFVRALDIAAALECDPMWLVTGNGVEPPLAPPETP